jgi:hypothetical protein
MYTHTYTWMHAYVSHEVFLRTGNFYVVHIYTYTHTQRQTHTHTHTNLQ